MLGVNNQSVSPAPRLRLAISSLVIFITLLQGISHAQITDTVAPIIELEELTEAAADRSQVFTVQIAEDNALDDATLYYRREGQLPFTPATMQPLGNTGFYTVSIPTDLTDLRDIEYYVQARDKSGNRTVSGFAFDPYSRSILPTAESLQEEQTEALVSAAPEPDDAGPPLLQRRWVQVTLGILAVGALASLAGGDDGEESRLVPLQFNLE